MIDPQKEVKTNIEEEVESTFFLFFVESGEVELEKSLG